MGGKPPPMSLQHVSGLVVERVVWMELGGFRRLLLLSARHVQRLWAASPCSPAARTCIAQGSTSSAPRVRLVWIASARNESLSASSKAAGPSRGNIPDDVVSRIMSPSPSASSGPGMEVPEFPGKGRSSPSDRVPSGRQESWLEWACADATSSSMLVNRFSSKPRSVSGTIWSVCVFSATDGSSPLYAFYDKDRNTGAVCVLPAIYLGMIDRDVLVKRIVYL